MAPAGEAGYARTSEYIGAFNGMYLHDAIFQFSPREQADVHSHLGVNAAGSAIGAAGCSYLADKYSRKRTIQWAAIVLTIGAAICAGAVNNGMFMAGRVINGLGIGALVTAIPM